MLPQPGQVVELQVDDLNVLFFDQLPDFLDAFFGRVETRPFHDRLRFLDSGAAVFPGF